MGCQQIAVIHEIAVKTGARWAEDGCKNATVLGASADRGDHSTREVERLVKRKSGRSTPPVENRAKEVRLR